MSWQGLTTRADDTSGDRVRWVILLFALAGWATPPSPEALHGWSTYERYCLACHGAAGDGSGPAAPFVWPRPRAFTRGDYKWRSTPAGQPPLRDDMRSSIELGAPGTAMPGFAGILSDAQIDDVIDVLRAFAPTAFDATPQPIVLGEPPPPDPARGAQLFQQKCAACHGPLADGHGGSSFALRAPPYDLRTLLHRPRGAGPDAYPRAAAQSIATGLAGTEMPTFFGTLPEADLWALADHITAIGGHPPSDAIAERGIDADRKAPLAAATWPGSGDDAIVFGAAIAPQGPPPVQLAPAEASLRARQCARCHAKQYREWETSVHRTAASPGLLAQTEYGMAPASRASCLRCHAPLAEQRDDAMLRSDSLSCAGCHVRQWTRRGPPRIASSLLPVDSYPLVTTELYERGDFCLPCHQLPPRDAVNGRPLLDTYREWLTGPYMRRGIQCQHCHMPNREHAFLGVHDPHTFKQGIQLVASAHRSADAVTAVAVLTNIGAGHMLPTTPTPAAWLGIQLLDARGQPIAGAIATQRIGRDVYFDGTWHERADTRIRPGESLTFARAWRGGRTADAASARVWVEVHPDDYYERFYADWLAGTLAPAQRALYEQALARARSTHYTAEDRTVPVAPSQP